LAITVVDGMPSSLSLVVTLGDEAEIKLTTMWANANVMVALPKTGGALCSTPQSLADAHTREPCSNAAET